MASNSYDPKNAQAAFAFFDHHPDPFCLVSTTGRMHAANRLFRQLFYPADEGSAPEHLSELMPAADSAQLDDLLEHILQNGHRSRPLPATFLDTQKQTVPVLLSGFAIPGAQSAETGRIGLHIVLQSPLEPSSGTDAAPSDWSDHHHHLTEILAYSRDIFYRMEIETGRICYNSNATSQLFGQSADCCQFFTFEQALDRIHPQDRSRYQRFIQDVPTNAVGKTSAVVTIEYRMRCNDGTYLWLSDHISLVRDSQGNPCYIVGTSRDVTAQKMTEQALNQANERLLTVLDSMDAPVYVAGLQSYEIIYMNRKAKEQFGYDKEGQTCWQVFYNRKQACPLCTSQDLADQGRSVSGLKVWEEFNPVSNCWYLNHHQMIQWVDNQWVRLQIAIDHSDHKKLQSERQKNVEQQQRMQKSEAIGTLAGGIAHDFNNLLSIILGHSELAEEQLALDHKAIGHLQNIQSAGIRARDVIRQLLMYCRKDLQQARPVDITPLVRETVRQLEGRLDDSINIECHVGGIMPPILADPSQVTQLLQHLSSNAADALKPNGGNLHIRLELKKITATVDIGGKSVAPGYYVVLEMQDDGCGISEKQMERIFDPYYSTKDVGQGAGLGLSVVQGIVESCDGVIGVESQVDCGTTMTVMFPAIIRKKAAPKPLTVRDQTTGRILFLDDEQVLVDMSLAILQRLGYSATGFTDARKALAAFSDNPGQFDLIITDLSMPKMNGTQFIRHVHSICPQMPCILCSGYANLMDTETTRASGAVAYFDKPFRWASLSKAIEQIIQKPERPDPPSAETADI